MNIHGNITQLENVHENNQSTQATLTLQWNTAVPPHSPHGTVKPFTHANEPEWQPVLKWQTWSADYSDGRQGEPILKYKCHDLRRDYPLRCNESTEMPHNVRLKLKKWQKNQFNHLWLVINVAMVTLNMLCQQNIHFHFACRRSCSSVFHSNISSGNQFSLWAARMLTSLHLAAW